VDDAHVSVNRTGNDDQPQLDLEKTIKAAEHFSRACQIGCRVIDAAGQTLYEASPFADQNAICDLASRLGPDWQRSHPDQLLQTRRHPVRSLCAAMPILWLLPGRAIWRPVCLFLSHWLTHRASPVILKDQVVGALIGGPVHLVDPEDLLFDDLAQNSTGQSRPKTFYGRKSDKFL